MQYQYPQMNICVDIVKERMSHDVLSANENNEKYCLYNMMYLI